MMLTISVVILLCLLILPAAAGARANSDTGALITITSPRGVTIKAELADTTLKRATGLMFRDSLPPNYGMLFVFTEEQEWAFWMKNTRIPLDIIWMDKRKTIIHVERNVPVCTRTDDSCPNYQPSSPAMFVLELSAGSADVLKLDRGMRLKFEVPSARP